MTLEYLPVLYGQNASFSLTNSFYNCRMLHELTVKRCNFTSMQASFYCCYAFEGLKGSFTTNNVTNFEYTFSANYKLKTLKGFTFDKVVGGTEFVTITTELEDTIINISSKNTNKFHIYGDNSHFISSLKGVRVPNDAPFASATAPQIKVSYTGLDRAALVQLFNDLPLVSNGKVIKIVGFTGTANLTQDDKAIALNKGWNITDN